METYFLLKPSVNSTVRMTTYIAFIIDTDKEPFPPRQAKTHSRCIKKLPLGSVARP